jgi:ChrR Cupin-like domain
MRSLLSSCGLVCGLLLVGCGSDSEANEPAAPSAALEASTVLDLSEVKTSPGDYEWFDFRPNVQKLILAGTAESKHIAILWYTVEDGAVGLHYHGKTESVYVIDGTQTDAKGVYETGTVYFNPPGSGHEVSDSTGFFLLSYAAPPDFAATDLIEEYTPIRVDTEAPELLSDYPFEEQAEGAGVFSVPLDTAGGLAAELIHVSSSESYELEANYLLVLEGSCEIEGESFAEDWLVVAKSVEGERYRVAAGDDEECLALGVTF